MRPRYRRLVGTVTVVAAAVTFAGCKDPAKSSLPAPSKAFCDAALQYDKQLEKVSKASPAEQARAQLPLVQRMADAAPADIRDAARTFADALRRRAEGDTSVVDDKAVTKAVDDVNRRAGNSCGLYQNQNGGGGI
jgi:hypothetical protein